MEAGRESGDLTFPLVYCPEFHFPEFNSAVADMKNSVAVSFLIKLHQKHESVYCYLLGPKQCHRLPMKFR